MIIDISSIALTPGNNGEDCLGNGNHIDDLGNLIPCCCDECDYLLCCTTLDCNCDCCDEKDCERKKII